MRKKLISFFLAIILVLYQNGITAGVFALDEQLAKPELADRKVYSKISVESDFLTNSLDIVLTKSASRNFDKVYTPRDFPKVKCIKVSDITEQTGRRLKKQIAEEKSGANMNGTSDSMRLDPNKFRRILRLELNEKQTKNDIIRAIKLLERRSDVRSVNINTAHAESDAAAVSNPIPDYFNNQWAVEKIQLAQALAVIEASVTVPVLVGIIDTGFPWNHPDIVNKVYYSSPHNITTTLHRVFGVMHPPEGTPVEYPMASAYHGPGVAGIVAGISPYAKLISLDVYHTTWQDVTNAVIFATNNNIPILNLSSFTGTYSDALYAAIEMYPGLFVCSANNQNQDFDDSNSWQIYPGLYPAIFDLPNLVTVGATALEDTGLERRAVPNDPGWGLSGGSNYGAVSVDLFAPGTQIKTINSSTGYSSFGGTSAASPFVAGVAALVKALYPGMPSVAVKAAILGSVDVLPSLESDPATGKRTCVTGGRLNAYNAVANTQEAIEYYFQTYGSGSYEISPGFSLYESLIEQKSFTFWATPAAGGTYALDAFLVWTTAWFSVTVVDVFGATVFWKEDVTIVQGPINLELGKHYLFILQSDATAFYILNLQRTDFQ